MTTPQHYKARIKEMIAKVPPSVLSGSQQKAADYKSAVEAAKAAVNQNNLTKLMQACSRLSSFY